MTILVIPANMEKDLLVYNAESLDQKAYGMLYGIGELMPYR